MKFRKVGQLLLALFASAGLTLGVTSCANDFTVGYIYVLGTQYNQISAFKEDNNKGTLKPISSTTFSSGGTNPVRAIIPQGGRFMYVLNQGQVSTGGSITGSTNADGSTNIVYTGANISVFSIGGFGQLTFQSSYFSQGSGALRLSTDSSGAHMYILDEYSPVAGKDMGGSLVNSSKTLSADFPCLGSDNQYHPKGDVTVFNIDSATGRLTLVTNQQNEALTYFPVGCAPVDFRVTSAYLYSVDAGGSKMGTDANADTESVFVYAASSSTGQLTLTQNALLQTGAQNVTAIDGDSANKYLYLLDTAGDAIYTYTSGTGGALTAVLGNPIANTQSNAGGPVQLIVDSTDKFVYVANAGPANGTTLGASDISGYVINQSTGHLDNPTLNAPYATGTVSGVVCIFQDPSNQFIYTAGSADNSITGRQFSPESGALVPLRAAGTFPTVGTPSWCLATSSVR
jgi:6-phosphogluconolactonase (cycloisomerase 2 family)